MRKTKIICTIGPKSENIATLTKMVEAGMNVARLNMSHGGQDEQFTRIQTVRKISKDLNKPLSILLDTRGPEVRLKKFNNDDNGFVIINEGDKFTFTTDDVVGCQEKVSVTYPNLAKDMKAGDTILVCDGLLEFLIKEIKGNDIVCECVRGGKMGSKKGMNFPKISLSLPYISAADASDLVWGCKNDIDYVAASFISTKENVLELRKLLDDNGGQKVEIIAKIENYSGVQNIDDILSVADGVMVARGDMGVEIPFAQLPAIQKMIIKKAKKYGKTVVTATEMLESMIEKPRPTRAEASDVANAVFDGTSAVMLSGETAMGKYPIDVVKAMSNIAIDAEEHTNLTKRFHELELDVKNTADAISHATCSAAHDLKVKCILVFTKSGATAKMISRFRPSTPIIAATFDEKTYSKLALEWGVTPVITSKYKTTDEIFEMAQEIAKKNFDCKKGDLVAVTAGMPVGQSLGTNILKVIEIK